jgi:hypothetical protein
MADAQYVSEEMRNISEADFQCKLFTVVVRRGGIYGSSRE